MDAKFLWEHLRERATVLEFEIQTIPQNKRIPLWFQVGIQGEYLIIRKAIFNSPSVNLKNDRKISYRDFESVFRYYDRWLKGESGVREEVRNKSQNTSYILALIGDALKIKV